MNGLFYGGTDIDSPNIPLDIPSWALQVIQSKELDTKYKIKFDLQPIFLNGDFNGDGQEDFACYIEDSRLSKSGIMVIHQLTEKIFIIGAGKEFGHGGADFSWLVDWHVISQNQEIQQGAINKIPPLAVGDSILLSGESASAVIYWSKGAYAWYQQGD